MVFRALGAALALVLAAAPTTLVWAQTCTPATPDGTLCEDDLDPCTEDACDDGVCEHETVGFAIACRPIALPFQRVLVLRPFTASLTSRVAALPTGDPPAFTSGQRAAMIAYLDALADELDSARNTLAGRGGDADDTAQSRAVAALPDVEAALRLAVLVRSLVRAAVRADQLEAAVARELERSTADLVRGAKAVRRDLRRLRKVSQVFQP
ncbi:MAG TPA: hypothetical protein VNO26_16980 [Candidatus Limnocylindria bacterium]|nr:hypothetical protein [Candidatus Limnocylindria bacterium]